MSNTTTVDPRTKAVQGRRFSAAAGPHGKPRNRSAERRQAIAEAGR